MADVGDMFRTWGAADDKQGQGAGAKDEAEQDLATVAPQPARPDAKPRRTDAWQLIEDRSEARRLQPCKAWPAPRLGGALAVLEDGRCGRSAAPPKARQTLCNPKTNPWLPPPQIEREMTRSLRLRAAGANA